MFTASVVFITIGACFFIGSIIFFKSRKQTGDPIYIDTTGIKSNDSKNYIDIWRGKTFNVKVSDKYDIIIGDIPFLFAIQHLEKIATIYHSLNEARKLDLKDIEKSVIQVKVFNKLIDELYEICFPFAKRKFGLKRAIRNKANNDGLWILSICEELTDYWRVTEKKLELLAMGETLKGTAGQMFTWDSLKVDAQGKILIVG